MFIECYVWVQTTTDDRTWCGSVPVTMPLSSNQWLDNGIDDTRKLLSERVDNELCRLFDSVENWLYQQIILHNDDGTVTEIDNA